MYGKVFASMWRGSLRGRPDEQLVLTYIIANCDGHGVLDVIPEVIADDTGIGLERTLSALSALSAPDQRSRTTESDGRRIVLLDPDSRDWGWRLVNYGTYRNIRGEDDRRRQNREAQARLRQRRKEAADAQSAGHADGQLTSAASAQAEAEAEEETHTPSLREGVIVLPTIDHPKAENKPHARRGVGKRDESPEFVEFYETLWPARRRVGRDDAWRKWQVATANGQLALVEQVLEAAAAWAAYWDANSKPARFIPHPATWLHQGRWKDAPPQEEDAR